MLGRITPLHLTWSCYTITPYKVLLHYYTSHGRITPLHLTRSCYTITPHMVVLHHYSTCYTFTPQIVVLHHNTITPRMTLIIFSWLHHYTAHGSYHVFSGSRTRQILLDIHLDIFTTIYQHQRYIADLGTVIFLLSYKYNQLQYRVSFNINQFLLKTVSIFNVSSQSYIIFVPELQLMYCYVILGSSAMSLIFSCIFLQINVSHT